MAELGLRHALAWSSSFIPESPNRTLVNPVLGISRNVDMADTVVNIQGGDVNGHLTELKVES